MRAELTCRLGCLEHGGELRASDRRHHAGGAHRARTDADLEDRRSGIHQVGHAVGCDDVARHDGQAEIEFGDGAQSPQHALLVAVRGVDHQHVDTGGGECLGLGGDIAVDADGGSDRETSVGIDRRTVERRAQRAAGAQRADEMAVVHDRHHLDARVGDHIERVPLRTDVVRVDRRRAVVHQVAELRIGKRRGQSGRGEDAEDVLDADRRRATGDHDPWPLAAGSRRSASAADASGGSTRGVSQSTGCDLTSRIAASRSCNGMSCGRTPRPPRRASTAAMRGPVTEFMFAATSGNVAGVPSCGARSTCRRLVTADLRGTRKTSE